jgi:NAD(P)H dehydrogenase (quinone)
MSKKIAVTGASGHLGRLVLDALAGTPDVVAITRDAGKLADVDGVEVREADFAQPSTLSAAFAGVDRVLLISTDVIGDRVDGHKAAIDAAVAAGVSHIAYTSVPDPSDSNPAAVADDHRQTEDHLRASGVAWTFLRNAIYAEMLVPSAQPAIATGSFVTNIGHGATAYIARADCAAVAAAVLTTDGHEHKAYDVTGPEALDADAQAALFSEASGKPVEVVRVDDDAFVAGLVEHAGMPEAVARMYATFGASARLGYADSVSTVVQDLTGRAPRPAHEVVAPLLAG